MACSNINSSSPQFMVGEIVQSITDIYGRRADELSCKKEDQLIIESLSPQEIGSGWILCKIAKTGQIGLVPLNTIKKLDDEGDYVDIDKSELDNVSRSSFSGDEEEPVPDFEKDQKILAEWQAFNNIYGFYHGKLNRQEAKVVLLNSTLKKNGLFLVRDCENEMRCEFALSILYNNVVKHYKIFKSEDVKLQKFCLDITKPVQKFNSIQELISYFSTPIGEVTDK